MGLLNTSAVKNNILTAHGFKLKDRNVTGELRNCYEKCIDLDLYYAWISVNPATRRVIIYVEYDCGGEVAEYRDSLLHPWSDQEAFFEELDEFVTDSLKYYREEEKDEPGKEELE